MSSANPTRCSTLPLDQNAGLIALNGTAWGSGKLSLSPQRHSMNRTCGKSKISGTIAGEISSMCSTMAACQPPCTMKIDLQLDSVVPQAQSAAAGLMNSKKNKKQGRAGIILRVKRRGSIATKFRAQTLSCFQLRVRRRSPLDAQTQP